MKRVAQWPDRLLWVDCLAGAVVGVIVLLLANWLSRFYGLPHSLVRFMGAANLLYASYSFSLARRPTRPLGLIAALAAANLAWAAACARWAVIHAHTATGWGMAQLLGEAVFVGALAVLEWRYRERLAGAARGS